MLDIQTVENWHRIKRALEKAGKTDCMFYKRACSILAGRPDPLTPISLPSHDQNT